MLCFYSSVEIQTNEQIKKKLKNRFSVSNLQYFVNYSSILHIHEHLHVCTYIMMTIEIESKFLNTPFWSLPGLVFFFSVKRFDPNHIGPQIFYFIKFIEHSEVFAQPELLVQKTLNCDCLSCFSVKLLFKIFFLSKLLLYILLYENYLFLSTLTLPLSRYLALVDFRLIEGRGRQLASSFPQPNCLLCI